MRQKLVIFKFEFLSGAVQKDLSLCSNNTVFLNHHFTTNNKQITSVEMGIFRLLKSGHVGYTSLRCDKNKTIL